jgi:hydrogenase maturation protease
VREERRSFEHNAPAGTHHILVIGLGNEERGDDAAGILAARLFAGKKLPEGVAVHEVREPSGLFHLFEGADTVILIDAVRSGSAPGTVHRIAVGDEPLEAGVHSILSHLLSLSEVVEVARELCLLPARLIVYGIEAARFERDAPLSPLVRESVSSVVDEIAEKVSLRSDTPL